MTSTLQLLNPNGNETALLDFDAQQRLAGEVLTRAREAGYVKASDIRALLTEQGHPANAWKEVLEPVRGQLRCQQGRYYPISPLVARLREAKEKQRSVQQAVRQLLRRQRLTAAQHVDRRKHARQPFLQPVTIHTLDGRALRMYSCDISLSGIRLIGVYNLQGARVRLEIPSMDGEAAPYSFALHVLWAKSAADSMFENGGVFESVSVGRG